MQPNSKAQRLLHEPENQAVRSLMVPMLLGMVAMTTYNLAHLFFIGQLGTTELAAVSFTFPVVYFIGSITVGFGHGTSSVCARLFGAGRVEDVGRVTIHAIALGIIVCLCLVLLGLSTIDPLFRFLGASESTLPVIRRYMEIYYLGMVFNVGPLIANPVLRASGDARTPAMIMLVSAGLNIILDPILIFGLFGAPRLGIEGAALATVITAAGTLTASITALYRGGKIVFPRSPHLDQLPDSWRRILHVGVPSMTSTAIAPITTAFITHQVAAFGQASVAGYGIASRIEGLGLLVLTALGTAVTPFVGQNFGARNFNRVANGIAWCQRFSVYYGLGAAIVLGAGAPYIAGIFTSDPAAIHTATLHMRIVPVSYLAVGVALSASNSFNAIGKPLPGMLISLTRTLLVYAPLAWVLSSLFGLVGIFVAACTANLIAGTVGYAWYRRILTQLR